MKSEPNTKPLYRMYISKGIFRLSLVLSIILIQISECYPFKPISHHHRSSSRNRVSKTSSRRPLIIPHVERFVNRMANDVVQSLLRPSKTRREQIESNERHREGIIQEINDKVVRLEKEKKLKKEKKVRLRNKFRKYVNKLVDRRKKAKKLVQLERKLRKELYLNRVKQEKRLQKIRKMRQKLQADQ